VTGADVGALLALTATLLLAYEFAAIVSKRLPTLSRMWQGVRDRSRAWAIAMGAAAVAVGLGALAFTIWLVVHLLTHAQSTL
jgi:hypothetical protein